MDKKTRPDNVDGYISMFPDSVQRVLRKVRATVLEAAPQAEETISYGMPAFRYHGILVYFAGYANHIGFYATPTGHKKFEKALANYKQGKGSVQFSLDKPIPYDLISEIVTFRVAENLEKKTKKRNRGK
ncbi:iron chaperone [Pareuzebyella sediminis]|uniref:iron chaperone n=1 Tax=Pareuzebyella sediminis TaxID=2607998 RepID=UPI0011F07CE3|nr:DUF1801 domain-containing protein [Pareuzebyella sediminis]